LKAQRRHHFLSRQLVRTWIRQQRTRPSFQMTGLACRLHVIEEERMAHDSHDASIVHPRVAAGVLCFDKPVYLEHGSRPQADLAL
jgi:hypothetical protein